MSILQYYGTKVLWYYGTSILWYYGTMVLWYYGTEVLWYYGTSVLWYYCTSVLWYYSTSVLWYYDTMVFQFFGTVVLWYFSSLLLLLCYCSALRATLPSFRRTHRTPDTPKGWVTHRRAPLHSTNAARLHQSRIPPARAASPHRPALHSAECPQCT